MAIDWYNEHRPTATLAGKKPNDVFPARHPAHRRPRFEARPHWPRGSPWALVRGKPGEAIELDVQFHAGRRRLPIVRVNRVA